MTGQCSENHQPVPSAVRSLGSRSLAEGADSFRGRSVGGLGGASPAPHVMSPLVYSCRVQFEVEIYKNDVGEWVATAVVHDVSVTGRTENEALALLMEKLAAHFKKA